MNTKHSDRYEPVVTVKTAKLAKRVGFSDTVGTWKGKNYYNHEGVLNGDSTAQIKEFMRLRKTGLTQYEADEKNPYSNIAAPTQSLLQKWLREEHNVVVEVKLNDSLFKKMHEASFETECLRYRWTSYYNADDVDYIYDSFNSTVTFSTYEEALEDGLYNALKVIKNKIT